MEVASATAIVVNSMTNESLRGCVFQFLQDDPPTWSFVNRTYGQGVTTALWPYPIDQLAHTIRVRVVGWGRPEAPVHLASQPITLTVGGNTSLSLSVGRDESSSSRIT